MASRMIRPKQRVVSSSWLGRRLLLPPQQHQRQQTYVRGKSSLPQPKSFLDATSDFWANLRRQAATALTSTLSPQEQHEMLNRLVGPTTTTTSPTHKEDEKNEDDNDDNAALSMQKTIQEAVAQARLQEAASQDQKWQQEKERILAEAEKAARQRVEAELRVQRFQQWQQAVHQAKQQQEEEEKQEENNNNKAELVVAETSKEDKEHPLLGRALVDLGYKRVHLVSAQDLATIQVWKKQRIYRHNRALSMAQDKRKTLHLGMPGVISLHEDREGKLSIIDGQHRVGMCQILGEKKEVVGDIDLNRILVEVFPEIPEHGDDHAKDLFLEINKAEPVKLVDMPGVATAKDRNIITDAAENLNKRFPDMFSASQMCRAPHLNIDNLRDALFAGNVIKRHNITTASGLEAWLVQQNELLAKKYADPSVQQSVSPTAVKKAIKFKFYLGLDSSWYYN